MADRENQVIARIAPGIATLDSGQWDALAGKADPFLSHPFLAALEESGSVGEGTGWTPAPIVVEGDSGRIAAALPAEPRARADAGPAGRTGAGAERCAAGVAEVRPRRGRAARRAARRG